MDWQGRIAPLHAQGFSVRRIRRELHDAVSIGKIQETIAELRAGDTSHIHVGNARTVLRRFSDQSFHCCVTSPPYYFVRDYRHRSQIGLEASPVEYAERIAETFDEVWRVLRDDGSVWLNLADNYCTRRAVRADGKRSVVRGGPLKSWAASAAAGLTITGAQFRDLGVKENELFLTPYRVVEALRQHGWFVRANIVWAKGTAIPEPQGRGRPTPTWEHVFLLTKIPSGYIYNSRENGKDVWMLPVSRAKTEHTAMMPLKLAERCIRIGSRRGHRVLDPFGGTGTTALAAQALGRRYDLIELNEEYAEIAREKLGPPIR